MPPHILSLFVSETLGERSIRYCCGSFYQHGDYFVKLKILLDGSRMSNLLDTPWQKILIILGKSLNPAVP